MSAARPARAARAPLPPCGPLMISLEGTTLGVADRRRLADPLVGGVILFAHNFESTAQLTALVAETQAQARQRAPLVLAADQEGGRVQRFHDGFTTLPPAAAYGRLHDVSPARARRAAALGGFVMASELRRAGFGCCFAPVLDLAGPGAFIGERALHAEPAVVAALAGAWMHGMGAAGFAAVAKHYPGHGHVAADSHHECPRDERRPEQIMARDVAPYRALLGTGLGGVMSAHVLYPAADEHAATYSDFWLRRVLRHELGFDGALFSDDLVMEGAAAGGTPPQRVRRALAAGCDMALLCNDGDFMDAALAGLAAVPPECSERARRLAPFRRPAPAAPLQYEGRRWQAQQAVAALLELFPPPRSSAPAL